MENDNYHSYHIVIRVLKASLNILTSACEELTKMIDVNGRAVILVGTFNVSSDRYQLFTVLNTRVIRNVQD